MKMLSYGLSHLLKGIGNPRRALLELNKLYQTRIRGNDGVEVVDREWDNLVILDACRYDTFERENTIDGDLHAVTSKGSQTVEFLQGNFGDGDYPEIVYVSANPNIHHLEARFHERIRLWEEAWDPDLNVVPPDAVTRAAAAAAAEYPDKRLIIHYMQPHFPFIGEFGRQLYAEGKIQHYGNGVEFWAQLDADGIKAAAFKQAYRENLRLVLNEVTALLDHLDGRTVVTSDHGNEFGRLGIYGHPAGVYMDSLVRVPWLVVNGEGDREIVPGSATAGPTRPDADIEAKLEYLGYK